MQHRWQQARMAACASVAAALIGSSTDIRFSAPTSTGVSRSTRSASYATNAAPARQTPSATATSSAVSEGRFQHADSVCTNDCVPRTGSTPSALRLHYFTTTFTSLPGTTITFTTVLPSHPRRHLRVRQRRRLDRRLIASRSHLDHRHQLAIALHRNLHLASRASSASATGHATRKTAPSPPIASHNSAARNGANGASISTRLRNTSPPPPLGTSPESIAASFAAIVFTSSIIAAMHVLKCQRPLKSSVIFAIV
jgi:hypothetical protein